MKIHSLFPPRLLALGLLALLVPGAAADVVELRSGELVQGRFEGGTQNTVRFNVGGQVRVVPVAEIVAISFDMRPAEPAPPAPVESAPTPAAQAPAAAAAPAVPPAPASITVPAGTALLVRLRDPLDSNRHGVGHRFSGTLEGKLAVGTEVVAPVGSTVYGKLTSAQQAGRVVGKTELQATLTGILIGGVVVPIQTGDCQAKADPAGRDTVRKVARGAAIGALVDGSKGARNGAKIGAGAAILTRGPSIYIPSGTLLEYRLTQPLSR